MNQSQHKKVKKHTLIMALIALGMFGFGFAMVPLYNVFCTITGLNGKTPNQDMIASKIPIDTSRYITVELLGSTNAHLNAEFYPQTNKFKIHPGEFIDTAYWVKNLGDKDITLQAIPSVSPGLAGTHVKKQVCFCFQHQKLAKLKTMKMPLRLTVHPDLPKKYSTVTIAYTLFDVTSQGEA